MKSAAYIVFLSAIAVFTTGCMPPGYERDTNLGPLSFMTGHPKYPCANKDFTSKAVARTLNLSRGMKNSVRKQVASVDGVNAESNSNQVKTQKNGLTCGATLTFVDGETESGSVVIYYLSDENGGGRIEWYSGKSPEAVQQSQHQAELNEQQAAIDKKKKFLTSKSVADFPYLAQINCLYHQNDYPFMACLQLGSVTSTVEVRNGQEYSMVQFYDYFNIPNSIVTQDGLLVLLRPNFEIKSQNLSNTLTMNLKIFDRRSNTVAYQKSAGQFDYISATNNSLSKSNDIESGASSPYEAEISCQNVPLGLCLMAQQMTGRGYNTNIEVRTGNFYKLYSFTDLSRDVMVLKIPLNSQFSIDAQNATNSYILNVKIKDKKTGKIIYQKSAGQYDYISIRN